MHFSVAEVHDCFETSNPSYCIERALVLPCVHRLQLNINDEQRSTQRE